VGGDVYAWAGKRVAHEHFEAIFAHFEMTVQFEPDDLAALTPLWSLTKSGNLLACSLDLESKRSERPAARQPRTSLIQ
jgi:hypothetical protein